MANKTLIDHMTSIKETVLAVTVTSVRPREMCRFELKNIQTHEMTRSLPVTYARILYTLLAGTYSTRPIFSQANKIRRLNDPTMETKSKQTNSLLHGETVRIGNYLIEIKYAISERSFLTVKMTWCRKRSVFYFLKYLL